MAIGMGRFRKSAGLGQIGLNRYRQVSEIVRFRPKSALNRPKSAWNRPIKADLSGIGKTGIGRSESESAKNFPIGASLLSTKDLETLPAYRETLEHFTAHGNHNVLGSTGFTSTGEQLGQCWESSWGGRCDSQRHRPWKVKGLSSLRKIPKINEKKIHLDSLKLFNRLIFFFFKLGVWADSCPIVPFQ